MSFPNYFGHTAAVRTLEGMIRAQRIAQTLLIAGPEGVGKATMARRFAAVLMGDAEKMEQDDLSLEANVELLAEREKLPSDKRSDDPLLLSSHPDFVTFPPDGPMRQISIQQMRLLKERSQFGPLKGQYRVFLIDQIDRANEQAANSLLKILEEPPAHLIVVMTAENEFDLLPTIRSRSVILSLGTLSEEEMGQFARSRGWRPDERRVLLAGGSPGLAVTMDLEKWDERRKRMVALLEAASGVGTFGAWIGYSEKISASKTEKLEYYARILYSLIEDVLLLREGLGARRNPDLEARLRAVAGQVSFDWLLRASKLVDDLVEFARRNVQKGIALDAFAVELRKMA